jgi:hypothetical protein
MGVMLGESGVKDDFPQRGEIAQRGRVRGNGAWLGTLQCAMAVPRGFNRQVLVTTSTLGRVSRQVLCEERT